jgi:GNAT superfamily N-acetyltransferase
VIRPLRPLDLPRLVELCAAHAAYERAPFTADGQVRRWESLFFGEPPRAWGLVLEQDGGLVGYATWSLELSTWRAAEHVHVDCLFLESAYRGRGWGRALLGAIGRHRSAENRRLEWQTPAWNTGAARFYERLGAAGSAKIRFRLEG